VSRSRHDVFALGLSGGELALARQTADGAHSTALAPTSAQPAALKAAVGSLLNGASITASNVSAITLGAGTLRHFAMEPPAGIRSLPELRLVATGRCAQIFGGAPEDWIVTGDWRASGSFLCAAVPAWVDSALRSCFPPSGTPMMRSSVEAAFANLRSHTPSNGWVGIGSPAHVVLIHLTDTRINACRTLAGMDQVATEVARYNLRLNLPAEEPVELFDSRVWLTESTQIPDAAVETEAGCIAWMGLRA